MIYRTDGIVRWLMTYAINSGAIMMYVCTCLIPGLKHRNDYSVSLRVVSLAIAITVRFIINMEMIETNIPIPFSM